MPVLNCLPVEECRKNLLDKPAGTYAVSYTDKTHSFGISNRRVVVANRVPKLVKEGIYHHALPQTRFTCRHPASRRQG